MYFINETIEVYMRSIGNQEGLTEGLSENKNGKHLTNRYKTLAHIGRPLIRIDIDIRRQMLQHNMLVKPVFTISKIEQYFSFEEYPPFC